MKKVIIVFGLLLSSCGSPNITCFYTRSYSASAGGFPCYEVWGRTNTFSPDVDGPHFQTIEEAQEYIKNNNLKMCGAIEQK